MAEPTVQYNDSDVPFGAFAAKIYRGQPAGILIAEYIFESFSPDRPDAGVNRPNQIGAPNGFTVVGGQETASGVVQIATTTTETPKRGDWFQKITDRKAASTAETWVITSVSDPYEMGSYAKCNISAKLVHGTAPTLPA